MVSCGGIGFSLVAAYRYQEQALRQLIRVLEYMSSELQFQMTPLPELCLGASQVCTGCVSRIFQRLSKELDKQYASNAATCMDTVVTKQQLLPSKLQQCLGQLGDSLGRFDLPGQLRGLEAVKKSAEFELDKLCRNQDVRLRSYQTLGLCAGAALVVLFI